MRRESCRSFFRFFVAALPLATLATSSNLWPYLQIYPPRNDSRTPLHFAVVLSFGGDYTSIGALPGVQIALDYINNEPSILPGYTLHYTLSDSQCNHSMALDSFFKQINLPPTKVGWVGSGCSPATEPTAELTKFYNITQLSCLSASPELRNRQRFTYLFRLLAADVLIAQGFLGIIENFGWRRVSIILQDEKLFTATGDALKEGLSERQIEHVEKRFRSDEGISGITTDLFEPEYRVFVLLMYSANAKDTLCEAYRQGIRYPKFMLITYGWYDHGWWAEPATSSEYNCTAEERATVLPYTMGPMTLEFPTNLYAEAEPGINAHEFMLKYHEVVKRSINQDINLENYAKEFFLYSYHCHEATIAFAYALNQTIADLNENGTLNREAAEQSGLPEGENFTMDKFTYNNSGVLLQMFEYLENTMFRGVSGNEVKFIEGMREIDSVEIYQYQFNSDDQLFLTEVAVVMVNGSNETSFNRIPNTTLLFPDGIPSDGIPIEEVVTVSTALTVIYVIIATAGLVLAVACLIFTYIFRKKKLIRLSSPNLNYIICLGAVILYLNVITFVIPTTNPDFVSVLCNLNPWLTSLGYSLCYGIILVKMFRVWIIFNKPIGLKDHWLQDYRLALFVLCLVIIDLLILGVYTLIEGLRGNLGVKLITNRENPKETIGPTAVLHTYFLYVCESDGQVIVYAFLYGYKGLLQVIAMILAFGTRKVKIKGMNDSKYVAAAVYVTSIVLAVTTVSTYTLMDYVNGYPAVVGLGFLLGTTVILGLVFVPRMVGLYKDPDGKSIVLNTTTTDEKASKTIGQSDTEIKILQMRITELENSLRQHTSIMSSTINSDVSQHNGEVPGERAKSLKFQTE